MVTVRRYDLLIVFLVIAGFSLFGFALFFGDDFQSVDEFLDYYGGYWDWGVEWLLEGVRGTAILCVVLGWVMFLCGMGVYYKWKEGKDAQ